MHAPRILPLLASVLAMPISLFIPILPGPSGIDIIIIPVFDILSALQLIIAAEAGTENAAVAATTAKNTSFRMGNPPDLALTMSAVQIRGAKSDGFESIVVIGKCRERNKVERARLAVAAGPELAGVDPAIAEVAMILRDAEV
jgi:hypothetical protein